jgi:type III secretory pathway component EscV
MNEVTFIENVKVHIKRPSKANKMIVDKIRHKRMDDIKFNSNDNAVYLQIFQEIMENIAKDYPELMNEVNRQIAKKKRWQQKRAENMYT